MDIKFESNSVFEAISRQVFSQEKLIDGRHRLFVQTWFVRLGLDRVDEYPHLLADLLAYVRGADLSPFLSSTIRCHPEFVRWFGQPLVGRPEIAELLDELRKIPDQAPALSVPPFIQEADGFVTPLGVADRLQQIVMKPYPSDANLVHYVVSQHVSHAYNVYPDSIVHFQRDNPRWYVAGFGHEAGHILTFDYCRSPDIRALCTGDATRDFTELLAHLCGKLLMDSYGISCREVFSDCATWQDFVSDKHPGKPLFDSLISRVLLGRYADFCEACTRVLREFA